MLDQYLENRALRAAFIPEPPSPMLGIILVIPAHDELSIVSCLESILACESPKCAVEVIVVFNASESDSKAIKERNKRAKAEAEEWFSLQKGVDFDLYCLLENDLPNKHAGVGLARKIGMDEAVRRYRSNENYKGIIACFDADSQCDSNYLVALERHFKTFQNIAACSIYFEHPIEGEEYSKEVYQSIYWYEMHLRYYKLGLTYAGLPFAFHSIGSSMAVKVEDYCREGGMNKRKAGEDFYFLQKFIDKQSLNELNGTRIIPSPRPSARVPFGTGRAISEAINGKRQIHYSYAYETFVLLKTIFSNVKSWYDKEPKVDTLFTDFIGEEAFAIKLEELRKHSTDRGRFSIRFFQWFNGFRCLKFIHYLRDHAFAPRPLQEEVHLLLKAMNKNDEVGKNIDLLEQLRNIDRNIS